MFVWCWVADSGALHNMPVVLGHALYMKGVPGGKTKNECIDASEIALSFAVTRMEMNIAERFAKGGRCTVAVAAPVPQLA